MQLLSPIALGSVTAPNRVMFGPHVTNLGADDRSIPDRLVAYYERRARGGCGTIVIEGASVHPSDWPYERALLAERCGPGWERVATACHAHGAVVIASLDHAGGQGSSAFSQAPLWAPSRVLEVQSREVPKWMEAEDIAAVVAGFERAASLAAGCGLDGVEVNAGQHSLVRQFLSGLTNHRDDQWGQDRLLFAREVVTATRAGIGDGVLGVRLSCDELAPWAGITPDLATVIAGQLVEAGADYIVVTRGSIYSVEQTRPDFHEAAGFNSDLCDTVRAGVHAVRRVPVVLQGSVVDAGDAERFLGGAGQAVCDAVEMTRAQIADPDLVVKVRDGEHTRVRPCTRCNQTCQVRDVRNPLVTCIGEPSSGHELDDPDWYEKTPQPTDVVVFGGGPAGLEAARVAAVRGHRVTVVERSAQIGGLARVAGPNVALVGWWRGELARLGVEIRLDAQTWQGPPNAAVIQATGSRAGDRPYDVAPGAVVLDVAEVQHGVGDVPAHGTVVVFDPIGGPIAVAMAEDLADRAVLITPDHVAGIGLARSGDLVPANRRLQQLGVQIERRTLLRSARPGEVEVEDRYTGTRRVIPCAAVIDCGFRLPTEPMTEAAVQIGDAVAPRTILEAVLDARRAALELQAGVEVSRVGRRR